MLAAVSVFAAGGVCDRAAAAAVKAVRVEAAVSVVGVAGGVLASVALPAVKAVSVEAAASVVAVGGV